MTIIVQITAFLVLAIIAACFAAIMFLFSLLENIHSTVSYDDEDRVSVIYWKCSSAIAHQLFLPFSSKNLAVILGNWAPGTWHCIGTWHGHWALYLETGTGVLAEDSNYGSCYSYSCDGYDNSRMSLINHCFSKVGVHL